MWEMNGVLLSPQGSAPARGTRTENLEPGEPPRNLDVEPEPAVTTGNLGPTVRNRNLEPIHGTCVEPQHIIVIFLDFG